MKRTYTEKELKILTIISKAMLLILGGILLFFAIIYPLLLIPAFLLFYSAYVYKAKNKETKTQEYKYSSDGVHKYTESLAGKKPADHEDEISLNFKITARIEGGPKQTFTTRVAGVSFNNPDGTSRQAIITKCKPGQPVKLVREKDNPYSKTNTTIAVYTKSGEQLGYIPSGDVRLASHMDRGGEVVAIVRSKGKKGKYYGLILEITKKDFDWEITKHYTKKNQEISKIIDEAASIEKTDSQKAIKLYRQAIEQIVEFDNTDEITRAWRNSRIPIDRLTLLLERDGKFEECLKLIEWCNNYDDHVGLTKAASEMLEKRKKRLEAKIL